MAQINHFPCVEMFHRNAGSRQWGRRWRWVARRSKPMSECHKRFSQILAEWVEGQEWVVGEAGLNNPSFLRGLLQKPATARRLRWQVLWHSMDALLLVALQKRAGNGSSCRLPTLRCRHAPRTNAPTNTRPQPHLSACTPHAGAAAARLVARGGAVHRCPHPGGGV